MLIPCVRCGRPVCAVEPPTFERGQAGIIRRTLSGFGLDLGAELDVILNPTPDKIATAFSVRCLDGSCCGP